MRGRASESRSLFLLLADPLNTPLNPRFFCDARWRLFYTLERNTRPWMREDRLYRAIDINNRLARIFPSKWHLLNNSVSAFGSACEYWNCQFSLFANSFVQWYCILRNPIADGDTVSHYLHIHLFVINCVIFMASPEGAYTSRRINLTECLI